MTFGAEKGNFFLSWFQFYPEMGWGISLPPEGDAGC